MKYKKQKIVACVRRELTRAGVGSAAVPTAYGVKRAVGRLAALTAPVASARRSVKDAALRHALARKNNR